MRLFARLLASMFSEKTLIDSIEIKLKDNLRTFRKQIARVRAVSDLATSLETIKHMTDDIQLMDEKVQNLNKEEVHIKAKKVIVPKNFEIEVEKEDNVNGGGIHWTKESK